jgi:hypothetical protein
MTDRFAKIRGRLIEKEYDQLLIIGIGCSDN